MQLLVFPLKPRTDVNILRTWTRTGVGALAVAFWLTLSSAPLGSSCLGVLSHFWSVILHVGGAFKFFKFGSPDWLIECQGHVVAVLSRSEHFIIHFVMVKSGCRTDVLPLKCVFYASNSLFPDGYPRDEIIYKWNRNSVATSDQKYWRLYQFDFMGLRNTTDMLTTTAGGKCVFKVGGSPFGVVWSMFI